MISPAVVTEVSIRPARADDYGSIERLLIESDLPTDGVRALVCGFLVAEAANEVVGVVGLEQCCDYGLLRSTAVAPQWRAKGVGRMLVERIVAEAEAQGIRALYLLTTTAEHYFPSFGFRVTSRESVPAEIQATTEFQTACPASATVMCLSLASHRAGVV